MLYAGGEDTGCHRIVVTRMVRGWIKGSSTGPRSRSSAWGPPERAQAMSQPPETMMVSPVM